MIDDAMTRPATGDAVTGPLAHPDEATFRALVDSYHAELVRVAYAVSGDQETAIEAAQVAWIKAWRGLGRLHDTTRVRGWLIAIAANEARQAMRARRRRALREIRIPTDDLPGVGMRVPVEVGPDADVVDLATVLARLDPMDRQLLAMRYVAGLDSDEIGRAIGISASGVRSRLSRLASRLREELFDG